MRPVSFLGTVPPCLSALHDSPHGFNLQFGFGLHRCYVFLRGCVYLLPLLNQLRDRNLPGYDQCRVFGDGPKRSRDPDSAQPLCRLHSPHVEIPEQGFQYGLRIGTPVGLRLRRVYVYVCMNVYMYTLQFPISSTSHQRAAFQICRTKALIRQPCQN